MKKKYIKNLVVRRALPLALVLTLTGCGTEISKDTVKQEADFSENTILEESSIKEIAIEAPTYYDELNKDGIFFEKVEEEKVTLEDIILTNEERGILSLRLSSIQKALTQQIQYPNLTLEEKTWIQRLNIRELMEEFLLSSFVTDRVEAHQNSSLYIVETNDLDWERLFLVLKENSQRKVAERQSKIENAVDDDEKSLYESLPKIEAMSDEDLALWVAQFHQFIDSTRERISNLDMERLACALENYCVLYENKNIFNLGVFASTNRDQMTYPLWNGYYPNLIAFEQNNYHEFRHLLGVPCNDEKNELGYLWSSGISSEFSLVYDENFIRRHHIEKGDFNFYFPFCYYFIEEGNAEEFSSSLLGQEANTYYENRFTLDNLKFSLFLQPGFDLDNFQKAGILHNPIALIQQFPILDGTSKSEEDWFVAQLEMLECYNIVNEMNAHIKYTWKEYQEYQNEPEKLDEKRKEIIIFLENYADLQMTRNFLWNLINYANTTKSDMTLEDCYYLMKLYQTRLAAQRDGVCVMYGIESLATPSYETMQEQLFQLFESYLKRQFYSDEFRKLGSYQDYNLEEGRLSDYFTEEEKRYFYSLFLDSEDYQKRMSEQSQTGLFDFIEEKTKKYYLVPESGM